jgi:outer membrane protein OmpA-like peptidoglycan-associated protein
MKNVKILTAGALCALMVFTGCSTMSNTGKGALYGGGGGAALGAAIGAIAGGGKGAGIGAAIGTAVGAGTGALIGRRMDRQQAELEQQLPDNVQIEQVTDQNNLQAIKVTFPDGILFATGKSDLNNASIAELSKLAVSLAQHPDTDITINGHTDNTGSRAINETLSLQRARSVQNFLVGQGLSSNRFTVNGLAYDVPVGDNSTAAGRARNRRVEVFLTASQAMIQQAQAGTLQ